MQTGRHSVEKIDFWDGPFFWPMEKIRLAIRLTGCSPVVMNMTVVKCGLSRKLVVVAAIGQGNWRPRPTVEIMDVPVNKRRSALVVMNVLIFRTLLNRCSSPHLMPVSVVHGCRCVVQMYMRAIIAKPNQSQSMIVAVLHPDTLPFIPFSLSKCGNATFRTGHSSKSWFFLQMNEAARRTKKATPVMGSSPLLAHTFQFLR